MGFWLAIFAGGGLGACLRVALMIAIAARSGSAFPWGLLAVNTLGCFSIGLVASFAAEAGWLAPIPRAFAVAGVLGGFTTFSSFGLDTVQLFSTGHTAMAIGTVAASVGCALLGVASGLARARRLA